jgi:rubredoxin
MVYTNDVARMSKHIEELIFRHRDQFYDNTTASGDELFALVGHGNYITKPAGSPAKLPAFNLPYYEGLNRYQDKYWLGVYRRDELFTVSFLKELCQLCLKTKIGQLCSTPWKTIIIKNIEEKDRVYWNNLLARHQVNVRHAANELNFQVEDNCLDGLALKHYVVKRLHEDDTRTFGICVGIKTRNKSEVFSSILVRKRPLVNIFGMGFLHVYDVLCAKDFNPNERTGKVFSKGNLKFLLPEQLRRAILLFYSHQNNSIAGTKTATLPNRPEPAPAPAKHLPVYQCQHCLSVYNENIGEPGKGIHAGTLFENLPEDFCCDLCDAPKNDFTKIDLAELRLQPV